MMFKEFYANADLLELPILAMLLFIGTFVGVLVKSWHPNGERENHLSSLPLNDDTEVTHDV